MLNFTPEITDGTSLIPYQAYLFNGYWEDIGTIKSFFDANLALTDQVVFFKLS